MNESHRELLTRNLVALTTDLDPSDIYDALITRDVLTLDDMERISTTASCRRDAALELISLLLRKGPTAFDVLMHALLSTYPHLYDLLSGGVGSNWKTFETLRYELQTHYQNKLRFIYPMPWVQSERLSLDDIYVERQLRMTTGRHCGGKHITIDQLFSPHEDQQNEQKPKRLLIQGDPALGKSTICQMLAYKWSQQSLGGAAPDSFELVVYLHAADFRAQTTVASAIKYHLLPRDCNISTSQIAEILEAKTVLLIIDGFDEAYTDNMLLDQVIERSILKHKTILITSRHNFLLDKLKYFDSTFSVNGYDRHRQVEHVERYAKHRNIDSTPLKSMLDYKQLGDLCQNPLNLTLLCLLHEEDAQFFITRTGLYTSIHNIIKRKAGERMDLTPKEVEDLLLRPLYKLAFEACRKNEYVLREGDFRKVSCDVERVSQVGYLSREVIISRLQEEVRFSFRHKTFLEFLTAKHIANMETEDRQIWLQNLSYTGYHIQVEELGIYDSFDWRANEPVLLFVFGSLKDNIDALVQMASVIMDQTHLSKGDPSLQRDSLSSLLKHRSCGPSHVLFRLIGELNVLPSNSKLVDAIVRQCPSQINLDDECSASCLRGIQLIGNLRLERPISLDFDFRNVLNFEERISVVKKVIKCKNIDCSRILTNSFHYTELRDIMTELRVGHADSFQEIRVEYDDFKDNVFTEIPSTKVLYGDDLRGVQLRGVNSRGACRFMEDALDKPLTSFGLIHCELDDRCTGLIFQLLLNRNLHKVALVSRKQCMGPFLGHLAHLYNLQSLAISITIEFTQEERNTWEAILKMNTISKLAITFVELSDKGYVCRDNFPSVLSNLKRLHLHKFSLKSRLNDNDLIALSGAIRSWSNLQELEINLIGDFGTGECPTESSVRILFEAITSCYRMEMLCLEGLRVQDSLIPALCTMMETLRELRRLKFEFCHEDNLTKEGFELLEPFLKRKGVSIGCNGRKI